MKELQTKLPAMPPEIAVLSSLGVADDLTSETRLGEDAVSYILIRRPAPEGGGIQPQGIS